MITRRAVLTWLGLATIGATTLLKTLTWRVPSPVLPLPVPGAPVVTWDVVTRRLYRSFPGIPNSYTLIAEVRDNVLTYAMDGVSAVTEDDGRIVGITTNAGMRFMITVKDTAE